MALAVVAAPASAQRTEEGSVEIEYMDLNLQTEQGRDALDRRIADAARVFCGSNVVTTGTRIRSHASRTCEKEMRADAKRSFATIIEDNRLGG